MVVYSEYGKSHLAHMAAGIWMAVSFLVPTELRYLSEALYNALTARVQACSG